MRKTILVVVSTIFLFLTASHPAKATAYQIDLNTVAPIADLFGSCYCGLGPEWSFAAQPGDTFDFGSVTFSQASAGTKGLPPGASSFYYFGDVDVSYNTPLIVTYPLVGTCYEGLPCSFPDITRTLQFTVVPDGVTQLFIAWDGPYVYTSPFASAVPEPATWAMILIGFGGIIVIRRRYGAAWNACTAEMAGMPVA